MTALYHPRPERWPQFTLRGLLIAITLAALLMPWAVAEYEWRSIWFDGPLLPRDTHILCIDLDTQHFPNRS